MATAIRMVSPAAISPANMVNLSRHKDFRFIASKRIPVLPSNCLITKFYTLTVSSRHAYQMSFLSFRGTSWNSPLSPEVDSVNEAESHGHAFKAAVPVFDAEEDKNVQQLAKSIRPSMSKRGKNPKHLSSSASERVELDYFQILKYPLVTELAMQEMLRKNTLVFVVDKHVDKKNIKAAVEKLSGIQIRKVNTLVMADGNKKAYIMLRPNHSALEVAKKLGII